MKDEQKRKQVMEHWNQNVACNAPSKCEQRKKKRAARSMKRQIIKDFEEYMNAIALSDINV